MPDAEMIINAFLPARKAGDAPKGAQAGELCGAPREQLVGIGLMSHIPYKSVPVEIENRKQGKR